MSHATEPIPTVFISATSRDLKSYRQVVAEWAQSRRYNVVVQEDFEVHPDYITVTAMLRRELAPCDVVIHLAGLHYGAEPTNFPAKTPRRSYTQLEYELGSAHQRPVYCFVAREDYAPDNPPNQTDEQRELQAEHRARLKERNNLYYEFSTKDQLRAMLAKIKVRAIATMPNNLNVGPLGELFKGREEFLAKLREALTSKASHVAAVTGKHAIHGLGGVGKTRAAIEYAWEHQFEYEALLFVTADSAENLANNLANLCGALVLNLPEQAAAEKEVQVAAAIRWLQQHSGWLLILDNVDTEEAQQAVEKLLLKLTTGHIIVTSRLADWRDDFTSLELDVLDNAPATEFLLARTEGKRVNTATDEADAASLATDLDGLALALEQAGAFIVAHRLRISEYHRRWKEHEKKVLEWFDANAMKYPRSVATTWQTSIDAIGEDGRALLNVLCWFAPDPIPREMIEGVNEEEEGTKIDVEEALRNLTKHSLATWEQDNEAIQVHRLVEEITKHRLMTEQREKSFLQALRMVNRYFPFESDDVRLWPACQASRPHALAVTTEAAPHGDPPPTTRLLGLVAIYLQKRAEYGAAEPLMRRALAIDERSFGPDHSNVAVDLNNLAQLLHATNRLSEAESLMRRTLAIDEQSFGDNHPSIARDLNNLARLFLDTNRLREAEPLMRRALEIGEQSDGPERRNVAIRLNNLAQLLRGTNRLVEAERLMRRALAIDEQSYGRDHPNVATDLNNLAELLHSTNRLAEAEPLIRRALEIDEQSFGPEHPSVALRLNNLALLLHATNRLTEAEQLMRRTLAMDELSLGPKHPKVAVDLNNLAQLLQDTNRLVEAEQLMRRALAIDEESFGLDHPNVAVHLNNLAQLLQTTHRSAEAEPLMARHLAILCLFTRETGHHHPHLLAGVKNYWGLLGVMNVPEPERFQRIFAAGFDPAWLKDK